MVRRRLNQRKNVVTVARSNPRRAAALARQRNRVDPRIALARKNQARLASIAARQAAASQATANKLIAQGRSPNDQAVRRARAQAATSAKAAKDIQGLGLMFNRKGQPTVTREAQNILARSDVKKERRRARSRGGITPTSAAAAKTSFATGGISARTQGQTKAQERFTKQQSITTQKGPTKRTVAPAITRPKPTKVKTITKTASGQSLTQAEKDAKLKALQLDVQKRFPDAVAKATGLSTTQVRNLSIQGKTVVPTSRKVQQNIKKNLTSEEKKQQLRDAGLTPTEKKVTVVNTPVVQVEANVPNTSQNVFDPNVSALTGVESPSDKAQNLKDQGLAISPIGPDGRVTIVRSNGKLAKVSPELAQRLANQGKIATGFDVETTIRSTESRPQGIDISSKPLVSPTRDEIGAAGGTPQEKSKEQLREETLAFRAGQSPNVTLFDIALDRQSKGTVFGPGEKIGRRDEEGNFVELAGTELAAVQRIREEQDIGRIANALQAQKFQDITGAKSGVEVLQGLRDAEARGEQQIIEPQFTFGTQQAAADVPFFEDRERIGGVDTPEKLAAIQERLDTTPSPSLQETLGFGPPVVTVENKFVPREPIAEVTTGTEQKLVALGFTPTQDKIESGIIPKAEGSLASVPNPTETFNPNVLGAVNQQFGGFNILQAGTQQQLAVQSLTQKSPEQQGFSNTEFDIITKPLTREEAREFEFVKEGSVVRADIGSPFGRQTGITLGDVATSAVTPFFALPLGVSDLSQRLGGPQLIPENVRNNLGDLGQTFAADIENEFIAVANIPKLPGAVSDLARNKVGKDPGFIEFNPTPQDLAIGGVIQGAIGSAIPRAIVSTPNEQGLVKAQLKDGTVIETTVGNAQRLADTNKLATIGGGGVEQFKSQNTVLAQNLSLLAQERPLAFVGSGLEFTGAAITGAKAISLTSKAIKGAVQAGKASKAAKTNLAVQKELPTVNIPSEIGIKSTVSNVGEVSSKVQKSGTDVSTDVISGGSFGKGFKDLFKKQKSNYDRLTKPQKERLIKQVLERNRDLEKPLTRAEAEALAKSAVNRSRPLNDLGLSDQELRIQEKAFRANQPIISTDTSKPLIARQFEFFRQRSKGLPEIQAGGGRRLGIDPKIVQENQATEIFVRNLRKAIKDAEEGGTTATTGKKPPKTPPSTPRTAGQIREAFAEANGISKKEAARQLDESGIIGRSVDDSAKIGGDSARKANNDIRVINDVKKGKIDIDDARDILQSRETKIQRGSVQTLISPEGKLKTISDDFTGVLIGNKVKQVPTKIIQKGDDFARVPDLKAADDLARITNVGDAFQRTPKAIGGADDLAKLGTTARNSLKASAQVLEETVEGGGKKGGSTGQQILKKPKIDEVPTLKNIRRSGEDGIPPIKKIPNAIDDFKPSVKSDLFGIITPKVSLGTQEALQVDETFSPALDITTGGKTKLDQLPGQRQADIFRQPQRQPGRLRQPGFLSLRSQQAPRLANQFTFDFGQVQDPRTLGRLRFGGLNIGSSAQDVGGDARDNARRFFRVFDVGRDRQGNPVPFGRVSRGLGVQVQAAAPIFEVEDVLGRRRARRPRQEEVFDIGFPSI